MTTIQEDSTTPNSTKWKHEKKSLTKEDYGIDEDICNVCFLIECCCEEDKLQVIKDEKQALKDGYVPLKKYRGDEDIRWVKANSKTIKEYMRQKYLDNLKEDDERRNL